MDLDCYSPDARYSILHTTTYFYAHMCLFKSLSNLILVKRDSNVRYMLDLMVIFGILTNDMLYYIYVHKVNCKYPRRFRDFLENYFNYLKLYNIIYILYSIYHILLIIKFLSLKKYMIIY